MHGLCHEESQTPASSSPSSSSKLFFLNILKMYNNITRNKFHPQNFSGNKYLVIITGSCNCLLLSMKKTCMKPHQYSFNTAKNNT